MPTGAGVRAVGHAGIAGLEARRGGGDAEIAAQRQVHASAHGAAVDGGDCGFVEGVQAPHQGVGGLGPAIAFQLATGFNRRPFGEIGPGAEAASAAAEDHGAHCRVALAGIESDVQGLQGGDIQCIALLRTIQDEPGDPGFDPRLQWGKVSHAALVLIVG